VNLEISRVEFDRQYFVTRADIFVKIDDRRVVGWFATYIGFDERLYIDEIKGAMLTSDLIEVVAWLVGHERYVVEEIKRYADKNFIERNGQ